MEILKEQVIKEPKSFIRVVQFVLALFALYTTSSFSTYTEIKIDCPKYEEPVYKKYPVSYPFDFQNIEITVNSSCEAETQNGKKFPMDFSSSAQFFVTTGVLSLFYSAGSLVGYSFALQRYQENALIPVLDLVGTSILSLFWIAGTAAWSAGVSDVKYYVHPDTLREHLPICNKEIEDKRNVCTASFTGKWNNLSISIIFGFGCIIVWVASIWFVYKQTQFFKQQQQQQQLLQQQQFGGQPVQPVPDPSLPAAAGTNPFGDFNPIGQQQPTNPYVQQNY